VASPNASILCKMVEVPLIAIAVFGYISMGGKLIPK
jgi:hypothetical protein